MRRLILFISVTVILMSLAGIESLRAQEFKGGIIAGVAGTQVKGDGLGGYDKAGIVFGPYVNLELSDKISMQMQLEYYQKGSRANPDSTNNFQSYLLRLNYMQIPVTVQYRHNEDFGLETGLSYGVLIHDYEEINGYTNFISQYPWESGDLSFILGAHWYLTDVLTAEFEFSHSLLYVREDTEGVTTFFNKGMYHNVIHIAIQYQIKDLFGR
jgi:hypothetical protein